MTRELLQDMIKDIILDEAFLEDVPYSYVDGAKQISSDSITTASERILKMLEESGVVKI